MVRQADKARKQKGGIERRLRLEWFVTVPVLMLLTFLLSYYSQHLAIDRLDSLLYGRIMALTAHQPSDDVVIVALDDASITELGHWPWRRAVHARLLERLAGARAVGLDLVLSDPNPAYPDDDYVLARAISQHGRVVLPLVVGHDRIQRPLPILADAAAALGFINVDIDPDGIVRSVRPYIETAQGRAEHFVGAMLDAAGAAQQSSWVGAETIDEPRLIAFAGEPGSFTMYPYARVLDGSIPPAALEDKYVLVGAWATALGDTLSVPLSRSGEPMAGVEILATSLDNALGSRWIKTPDKLNRALLSMLPILVVWLALSRLSPGRSFVVVAGVAALIVINSWLLMRNAQVWMGPSAALIGIVLTYPVWGWRLQAAALKQIDAELDTLYAQNLMHTQALPDEAVHADDRSLPTRMVRLHRAMGMLRHAIRLREEALHFLSHDMRSPQNAILALTQLQRHGKEPLSEAELLDRIDRNATRTLRLVDGFVRLARAESTELAFEEIDLADLLQSVCDEYWPMAQRRQITLEVSGVHEPALVSGDGEMLGRALGNLIVNAIQYSPSGSAVLCRLQTRGAHQVIEIKDTGRGMTPEQQVSLFEPFRRFDVNAAGNPEGSGLGLALVRAVILRHGGRIEVESAPGKGSVFRLSLWGLAFDDAEPRWRPPGRQ